LEFFQPPVLPGESMGGGGSAIVAFKTDEGQGVHIARIGLKL